MRVTKRLEVGNPDERSIELRAVLTGEQKENGSASSPSV